MAEKINCLAIGLKVHKILCKLNDHDYGSYELWICMTIVGFAKIGFVDPLSLQFIL